MNQKFVLALVLAALPGLLTAQMGGMGGGMSGSGMGMVIVADDGSVLLETMSGNMMGGQSPSPAVVNVGTTGQKRWEADFTSLWPMMPVTKGTLVLVPLVSGMWTGGMGGDGGTGTSVTLTALNLADGQTLWSRDFTANMIGGVQFSSDGSRIYLTLVQMGSGTMGSGSMGQGDSSGMGGMGTSTLVALDASGNTLWTYAGNGGAKRSSAKVKP